METKIIFKGERERGILANLLANDEQQWGKGDEEEKEESAGPKITLLRLGEMATS